MGVLNQPWNVTAVNVHKSDKKAQNIDLSQVCMLTVIWAQNIVTLYDFKIKIPFKEFYYFRDLKTVCQFIYFAVLETLMYI